jgi:peptidoglycan/LPS O-acetylase OafA/YrhL
MSFPGFSEGLDRAFVAAADGFAAGGLLAILRDELERRESYMRWLRAWWVPLLLPLAAVADQLEHHPLSFFVILQPLVYLALAVVLHRTQMMTNDRLGRLLNWPPLMWVGGISYSLYLWQQPFLGPDGSSPFQVMPLNLIIAVTLAWASYRCIERPCLRLRDRWWPAHGVVREQRPATATPALPEAPA